MTDLIKWAYRQAILTGSTDTWEEYDDELKAFISAETVSRVFAVKSLHSLNPSLVILQEDLTSHFDCKVWSGGTWQYVEHKYRNVPSTRYRDCLLSAEKFNLCKEAGALVMFTFADGVWYLFDLAECNPRWSEVVRPKYTAVNYGKVAEKAAFLKYKEAIASGRIGDDRQDS